MSDSPDVIGRRERRLLAAVLLLGLVLRLAYFAELRLAPDFALPQFESQYHDYWARAWVTGDWTPPAGVTDPEIPSRPFFRPPGYPLFLAAIYSVCGLGYSWPRLLQMVLGLLSSVLAYLLARRAFGRLTAGGTVFLTATYWLFIFFEGEFMEPALLIFLLLLAFLVLSGWRDGHRWQRAAAAGVLLGSAALVRPNVLVLPPFILLWLAWIVWRDRRSGHASQGAAVSTRSFLVTAVIFSVACGLAVLPVTVRNLVVADDLVWITSNGGVNLFVGTHPASDGYTPGVPELGELTGLDGWDSFDYPKIAAAVEKHLGRRLADSEVSQYFTERAFAYLRAEPLAVLRLTLRKLALFWGSDEVSNNKVITIERRHSPTLRLGFGFATILALALFGGLWLVRDLRSPGRAVFPDRERALELAVLFAGVVVVYSASFLPFFAASRFRVPILPLLMIFGAYGLAALWRAGTRFRLGRLAAAGALFLVLRLLTGIAWVPYEPDQALWHWRRGLLYRMQGESAPAIAELERAVELAPRHGEAWLALADELAKEERLDAAIDAYRTALELLPGEVMIYNNLATALVSRGDLAAAIASWQEALELDPERLSVLNNLAFALATRPDPEAGDRERAVDLAEHAAQLTGYDHPAVLQTLAVAYRAAGRDEDAAAILRQLREDHDDPRH